MFNTLCTKRQTVIPRELCGAIDIAHLVRLSISAPSCALSSGTLADVLSACPHIFYLNLEGMEILEVGSAVHNTASVDSVELSLSDASLAAFFRLFSFSSCTYLKVVSLTGTMPILDLFNCFVSPTASKHVIQSYYSSDFVIHRYL